MLKPGPSPPQAPARVCTLQVSISPPLHRGLRKEDCVTQGHSASEALKPRSILPAGKIPAWSYRSVPTSLGPALGSAPCTLQEQAPMNGNRRE